MALNNLNLTKVLDDFGTTTMPNTNFSSYPDVRAEFLRQTYISKQESQIFTQLAREPLTRAEPCSPVQVPSEPLESLVRSIRDAVEKSPSYPSPKFGRAAGTLHGMPYYLRRDLIEPVPEGDWSQCRSPSRARRRHAQGFKQHVVWERPSFKCYIIDDCLFMHPVFAAKLRTYFDLMGNRYDV